MVADDIVTALEIAANTIHAVPLSDRRHLITAGIEAVSTERSSLVLKRTVLPIEPGFMRDMHKLAQDAGCYEGAEVIVGAGMLMLAAEIERLRLLNRRQGKRD